MHDAFDPDRRMCLSHNAPNAHAHTMTEQNWK